MCYAEEAIGLAKSIGWDVNIGVKHQTQSEPAVLSPSDTPEDSDPVPPDTPGDEWSDPALRESIALGSLMRIRTTNSNMLMGKGQLTATASHIRENNISVVFLNCTLTPTQQRNLEKCGLSRAWNLKNNEENREELVSVVDRFGIILKIFSDRAKTKTAKLQLELAWIKYLKARLVRGPGNTFKGLLSLFEGPLKGESLPEMEVVSARERGGKGALGGQGETQLEIERRLTSDREAKLRHELVAIQARTKRQAKDPSLKSYPTIAIIGYTNAGKTALMNYFTGANLVSENLLFQTLNTTARQLQLPSGQLGLLLDTVGFISDLPHDLVEPFKATLEGAQTADVLLHIRDISHPLSQEQQQVVFSVLEEIGVTSAMLQDRYIEAWNKVDKLDHDLDFHQMETSPFPIVPVSVLHGINCTKLLQVLDEVCCRVLKKHKMSLVFPVLEYQQRIQWLNQNLNMVVSSVSTDSGGRGNTMKVDVVIDEVTLKRYLSHFGEEVASTKRR